MIEIGGKSGERYKQSEWVWNIGIDKPVESGERVQALFHSK
jgi:hypothetical protein